MIISDHFISDIVSDIGLWDYEKFANAFVNEIKIKTHCKKYIPHSCVSY